MNGTPAGSARVPSPGAPEGGPVVVAVDFGAGSIRVSRVDLGQVPPRVEVVHRYGHAPVRDDDGVLRWDWDRLVREMEHGLEQATAAGPVASIGVDTWAVDYGLLDGHGKLIAPPVSYRDSRTDGYAEIVERVGAPELYGICGLQVQPFNTLFQVAVHDRAELARAERLLFLPELLVHHLTGEVHVERTSAGSSALMDIRRGTWSDEAAAAVGLDLGLLPPHIVPAGTPAGTWRDVPVVLVGGHDTASAVVAMGADPAPGAAFVSSGTWLLVGREQSEPDLSEQARLANFSNEQGALGGIRKLKNLAGWWLLEGCRQAWAGEGGSHPHGHAAVDDLLAAAAEVPGGGPTVDPTDPRFLHPHDMLGEVTAAAGIDRDAPPARVTRIVVDSMAAGTARVLDELGDVTEVHVFGGGRQADLYRRLVSAATGLPVVAGPVEATSLGNALVQGVSLGVFADLAEARAALAGVGR